MQKDEFQSKVMVLQNKMYRFALSYLKNESEAKDVVQDVLMKLWETKSSLAEKKNIESWAMTLVRNKALDKLKRVGRKFRSELNEAAHGEMGNSHSPMEQLAEKEGMGLVRKVVQKLPENQAQSFFLREIEGYSYDEIADTLKISMSQVKVNIFRARKSVKTELEKIYAYGQ